VAIAQAPDFRIDLGLASFQFRNASPGIGLGAFSQLM